MKHLSLTVLLLLTLTGCTSDDNSEVNPDPVDEKASTASTFVTDGIRLKGMNNPTKKVVIPAKFAGSKIQVIDNFAVLLNAGKAGGKHRQFTHKGTGVTFSFGGSGWSAKNAITEEIVLPKTLKVIAPNAFRYCSKLKKINFPEGLEKIGAYAFEWCGELEEVEFPRSLREIGKDAFSRCHSLKKVTFKEGIQNIGGGAFGHCNLVEIIFPKSLKSVGPQILRDNDGLERVVFLGVRPAGGSVGKEFPIVGERFDYGFSQNGIIIYKWKDAESADIPDTIDGKPVTSIGAQAFRGHGMEELILPSMITEIRDLAFAECRDLKRVKLPLDLQLIGGEAFMNCSNLLEVEIPPKITTIQYRTFQNTGLKTIVLGENIKRIEREAFGHCEQLTSIVFLGDAPEFSTGGKVPREQFFHGSENVEVIYYRPSKDGWRMKPNPTSYWVKRIDRVRGQFSRETILAWLKSRRLKRTDYWSVGRDGPWKTLGEAVPPAREPIVIEDIDSFFGVPVKVYNEIPN